MKTVALRRAQVEDAEAICRIFGEYEQSALRALKKELPSCGEMGQKICICQTFYPFLVAEADGVVVGYGYAGAHEGEVSFGWNAVVSVYVERAFGGHGIGRALHEALEGMLKAMGVVNLYSVATFHAQGEYFQNGRGYLEAGRLLNAAFREGKWRDLIYYEKQIALHDENPTPVRPVDELREEEIEQIFQKAIKRIR